MPKTKIIFYQETEGISPVIEWLQKLLKTDRKGFAKCVARIEQLASQGHKLRRPTADYLRDDIWELRAKQGTVQYRIFYFYYGQNVAIIGHAIIKKSSAVPPQDIERVIDRKIRFAHDPQLHTYQGEINDV
ncbi:type II toxin-antitoxin system RelE/ParE family toxin [Crocosphaera sp. XPORK-15E]|uniref:type II toxin-antitoxin system RelE/ParE family toxin n=1 Tax=Crocosphaera sp. XPORK-15E TaxID=3110247 RepID=UPI002B218823|nr:type II toxin-antitoxin system RelE/ParE family toxin [Crocosphaera sp. XPORK-15E]MEA5534326.1 type II toxin-antitoxin system RelE/ParE family toxin [Crocosphaera sp. XPORK-15E]